MAARQMMQRFSAERNRFKYADPDQVGRLNEYHAFNSVLGCLNDLCDVQANGPSRDFFLRRYELAKSEWGRCLRALDL